jgi:rSAM/selenodomain-associated transferase 2
MSVADEALAPASSLAARPPDADAAESLSVVILALNAAGDLPSTLASVTKKAAPSEEDEILLSDGGSDDETCDIAESQGATILKGLPGRGHQLRRGAEEAHGSWLLFLHSDTRLGVGWRREAARFMADPANRERAGVFRFALDDRTGAARRLERGVRLRGRYLGLPFGDQGLLIRRDFYHRLGGYRDWPLMEDVDFIRRIGARRITHFETAAITSPARYRRGYVSRSARNLFCLALYFLGVAPKHIVWFYR